MINEENIITSTSTINDTVFDTLSNPEKLIVLANLLIDTSINYLPMALRKDAVNIVSNGNRVSYELIKYPDNNGLLLALRAHLIIDTANNIINGENLD